MRQTISAVAIAILMAACGGSSPTSPTPTSAVVIPTPAPELRPANISGTWTGTLTTDRGCCANVRFELRQDGTAVSGTWTGQPQNDFGGEIAGTLAADGGFAGSFTIDAHSDQAGIRCRGTATINGSSTASALIWTSPEGFDTPPCTGAPKDLRFHMSR
jgi:hypothetical protein